MSAALALRDETGPTAAEGEFDFSEADFSRIAALLHEQAGIALQPSKSALVYSRLAKRLRTLGLNRFSDYCELVDSPAGADERGAMLNALTTNVTRFFREPHHFDHLREKVLRPAADRVRSGGRLRLWSAGCSTGQEPYSMALTVLSVLPEAPDLDVRILATDIDTKVLAVASEGAYADDQVAAVPDELRGRWIQRDPEDRSRWRIGASARALVTFKPLNLIGDWPVRGPFDAIFCRNVAIYFDEPTQEVVWSRFAPLLARDGRLYVGHSERAASPDLVNDGLTAYRRAGGGGS